MEDYTLEHGLASLFSHAMLFPTREKAQEHGKAYTSRDSDLFYATHKSDGGGYFVHVCDEDGFTVGFLDIALKLGEKQ